jgi:hypothetical protein
MDIIANDLIMELRGRIDKGGGILGILEGGCERIEDSSDKDSFSEDDCSAA